MANRVPITVRLDHFEGPLDLLLYLIQSHELDISKVAISRITDQYLGYVRLIQELNFDIASEFLVMAATLLHWKSKALLPQEPKLDANGQPLQDEEFSQEELVRQLMEHQRFLQAGESLAQLPRLGEDVFTRPNRRPEVTKVWKELNITDLALGYQDILVRARKRTQVLRKETVSLADKIVDFRERLTPGALTEIRKLMSIEPIRAEVVVTFLASLELSRLKKMKLYQEEVYGPIYVELLESLKDFDTELATGFGEAVDSQAEAARNAAADAASDGASDGVPAAAPA